MDHSDTMEALCKAAAAPLQHRQAAAEGQDENSQPKVSHQDSELQKSQKLGWVSGMLFIYYSAQNTDTGCAITSFQTRPWAVPCCVLQLSAVLCTLVLQERVLLFPHSHLIFWSSTQSPSCSDPHRITGFFFSWIPDAACKLHSIFYMMFKRWVKNPLNLNYRRTHTGVTCRQDTAHSKGTCLSHPETFQQQRISLQEAKALKALTSMMLSLSTLEPTWYSADVSWYKSPASTEVENVSAAGCSLAKTSFHKDTACSNASHLLHYFIKSSSPSFLPPSTWAAWAMLGHLFSSNFSEPGEELRTLVSSSLITVIWCCCFIKDGNNGKSLHDCQEWLVCGKIKGIAWTMLGRRDLMYSYICAHTDWLCRKILSVTFHRESLWLRSYSFLSPFHNDEQKIKLRQIQSGTKDGAKGKKSQEKIQVIWDRAGIFHHYVRESWLSHKGAKPMWKIKENQKLSQLPLSKSFPAALGTHFYALSQLLPLWDENNKFYLVHNEAVTIAWKYCKIAHAVCTWKRITLDIIAFGGFNFIHQIVGTPFGYFFREHFLIVRQVLFKKQIFWESQTQKYVYRKEQKAEI